MVSFMCPLDISAPVVGRAVGRVCDLLNAFGEFWREFHALLPTCWASLALIWPSFGELLGECGDLLDEFGEFLLDEFGEF